MSTIGLSDNEDDSMSTHTTMDLPAETCCWVFARQRCCCGRHRSMTRSTALRKQLTPLINDPEVQLRLHQRKWIASQVIILLEDYQHRAIVNERWFTFLRRILIFLTVLLPALIIAEKTNYVQDSSSAIMVFFIIMLFVGLINNYLTIIVTDFQYQKRAVLYAEAQTSLHAMINNFLTRTQRYSTFKRPENAFRTFARDVSNLRIMVMKKANFLRTGSREQDEKSTNPMVAGRREFRGLFDPLQEEEAKVMHEVKAQPPHLRRTSNSVPRRSNSSLMRHLTEQLQQKERLSAVAGGMADAARGVVANVVQGKGVGDVGKALGAGMMSGLRQRHISPPREAPVEVPAGDHTYSPASTVSVAASDLEMGAPEAVATTLEPLHEEGVEEGADAVASSQHIHLGVAAELGKAELSAAELHTDV